MLGEGIAISTIPLHLLSFGGIPFAGGPCILVKLKKSAERNEVVSLDTQQLVASLMVPRFIEWKWMKVVCSQYMSGTLFKCYVTRYFFKKRPDFIEATSCFSVAQMICCPILISASSRLGRLRVLRTPIPGLIGVWFERVYTSHARHANDGSVEDLKWIIFLSKCSK